jgi:ectoine hydroxylase-related dioxygenase (phytanoyl-CoA dioxygenase family)
MARDTLTEEQKTQFHEKGYLLGLPPIYTPEEVDALNAGLEEHLALLEDDEDSKEIREWHEASRFLFDICMNEKILDYVEDLIGPDFYMWASNFFIKEPKTLETVAWHQDSYYWPLTPPESLTVWIAFRDSDEENGAMEVIPGSHNAGLLRHNKMDDTESVLTLECDTAQFREDEKVPLSIKAGCISIHDDKIVHGSPANPSDRPRVAFTVRYSKTKVKCDTSVNPFFRAYHCRGTDTFKHNPVGTVPTERVGRIHRDHRNIEDSGDA